MSWISSLFKSKNRATYDLSDVGVDMHSHLIPGIDDGSQSMDQTIGMLLKFKELGYKKVITTPHIMSDLYKNTPQIINKGLGEVRKEIEKLNIDIEIDAAAEYFTDSHFLDLIEEDNLLTFGGNKVLFEFSFAAKPMQVNETIFALKTKGYQPVLAHFERYSFFLENGIDAAKDFKKRGVDIQMNLNSLTGHYGLAIKKQAQLLVDHQLVDYVGTDCHRIEHLQLLENSLSEPYFLKLKALQLKNRLL
jgi:tyrosine-protein phosphatase YwqE